MDKEQLKIHREEVKRQIAELEAAAAPLMKLLCEKYDPYVSVRVTDTSVELVDRVIAKYNILDYVNNKKAD